jgi:predicted transcriptional regulator
MQVVDQIRDILEKLALLFPILVAVGGGWTWLPKVRKLANDVVIPVMNAIITFLVVFAGPVQAGLFDSVLGRTLSTGAGIVLSMVYSASVSLVYDKFVKPALPKTPYRVEQERKAAQ